jgi:chemotaxis protein histidine kinase CheA/ActR/RegA family two-component response regulator
MDDRDEDSLARDLDAEEAVEGASGPGDSTEQAGDGQLSEHDLAVLRGFQTTTLRPSAWKPPQPVQAAQSAQPPPGDDASLPAATSAVPESMASHTLPAAGPLEDLDVIPPELKRLFVKEAAEALDELRWHVLRLEREHGAGAGDALLGMGRVAHRVKGTAATLGYEVFAGVTLIFEDVARAALSRPTLDRTLVAVALVALLGLLDAAQTAAQDEREPDPALIERAAQVRGELLAGSPTPAAEEPPSTTWPLVEDSGEVDTAILPAISEMPLRVDLRRLDELLRHVSGLAQGRASLLRVRAEAMQQASELERLLARAAQLVGQITDARPAFPAGLPVPATSGTPGGFARRGLTNAGERTAQPYESSGPVAPRPSDLDLERFGAFDEAMRAIDEVVQDLSVTGRTLRDVLRRLSQACEEQEMATDAIQRDVMRIRLVPLSEIVPRLAVQVRRLAAAQGKLATFSTPTVTVELDRVIVDGLAGPLLQIVRNAVVHGIESPSERTEAGKPTAGVIWLRARTVGHEVEIELGDDGHGVNPHLLAASALAAGLLSHDLAQRLSVEQALDLMFLPGVSSLGTPDLHGGRGMGLDEVRAAVERLKGTIVARSEPGKGLVFVIRVPVSLSVLPALTVRAGSQRFALPFAAITASWALPATELLTTVTHDQTGGNPRRRMRVRTSPRMVEGGEQAPVLAPQGDDAYEEIPALALGELLGVPQTLRDPQPALCIEAGARRLVLLVDELGMQDNVVVQALPPHLRRELVRGIAIAPDGELVLVLDPDPLVRRALGEDALVFSTVQLAENAEALDVAPRVLVVDDSLSIRRALELTLKRAGYDVQLAHDGSEALDLLLAEPPAVVVLDIEMPRLDGFELLGIIRRTPRLAGVRTVMLTSRATPQHQAYARELGADAYLIKPCTQETFLQTISALMPPSEGQ